MDFEGRTHNGCFVGPFQAEVLKQLHKSAEGVGSFSVTAVMTIVPVVSSITGLSASCDCSNNQLSQISKFKYMH